MADKKSDATQELKQLNEYAVTPSDLMVALDHLLAPYDASGKPKEQTSVMVWGAMGIGKTEIIRGLAKKWHCRVVALHLPQFDPTDIKGIPVRMEDGSVKWVASSYMPQEMEIVLDKDMIKGGEMNRVYDFSTAMKAADDVSVSVLDTKGNIIFRFNDQMSGKVEHEGISAEVDMIHKTAKVKLKPSKEHPDLLGYTVRLTDKAVLFLDELSAAVPQVQNAALQLVLDKRVSEYEVPSTTPIVAAGNREGDGAFIHPMSAPLSNRFCHLRLMESLKDWLEWAIPRRVHPHVIGYLNWKGVKSLLDFEPDKMTEGDGGFATPRSWYKLSCQMTRELPDIVMNALISGFIGKSMGADFISYRAICELLPSTEDILRGRIKEFDREMNIGEKYGLATALCYKLHDFHVEYYDNTLAKDEEQSKEWMTAADSFCDFIDRHLGREMTVLCIHIVSRHLNISFTKFKDVEGKNRFVDFANKYRDILRRVV